MTRKSSPADTDASPELEREGLSGSEPQSPPPAAAGSDERPGDAGGLSLESRLAAAEAKRDEYVADLQRLAAEYENYRKRAVREQERLVAHAHERLVRELLPVLDDLARTLEAAERHEEAALVEGVRLVERSLRRALEKEGLLEIETDGAFDPHVHEALLVQPRGDAQPGAILEVVQRGYRLGDKVVRPARVIVAE